MRFVINIFRYLYYRLLGSHIHPRVEIQKDVFIGSGGTMTAESALLGVPTISYNAIPNIIEKVLVKKGLVKRETDPKRISNQITKISKSMNQKRAKKITNHMDDPIEKLIKVIRD